VKIYWKLLGLGKIQHKGFFMTTSIITTENWTFTGYMNGDLRAFVTIGASPESVSEGKYQYFITVLRKDHEEVFSKECVDLNSACLYVNSNYKDWTFNDLTAKSADDSGCATCVAH
jgi:hypothetical protein